MLRTRVVPIVLLSSYSVLKTIQFNTRRNLGNPITVARIYNTRNVDELVLLDIDATKNKRPIDMFTIQDVASECFMPLTVGGGIRSLDDIRNLLKKGADKISINSYALENPNFIKESSTIFGAQCIVVSVDLIKKDNQYHIYSKSPLPNTEKDPVKWCQEAVALGAGEILINFVDRDGMMNGIDADYIQKICASVNVPVIAAGGISGPQDAALMAKAGVSAVAAASIFHFTNHTPLDCKHEMAKQGIAVRI